MGEEIIGIAGANYLELEFEAHAGRAPVYQDMGPEGKRDVAGDQGRMRPVRPGLVPRIGGAASGAAVHTSEGLWPVDTRGTTNLPGLYAAGDSCSTMQVGAVYPGVGYALCGAAVSGARAGVAAAEYARLAGRVEPQQETIGWLKASTFAPFERKGGFSPRWVTQVLRDATIPYYVLYVKHEARIKATLALVEFMRDHLARKLMARDPHELRLAIETKNMILNAEMKLRASLYRTESRGTHYREDHPRRVDPEWLAWVTLSEQDGAMRPSKKPVPEAWWPDLALPYEERYPKRLPGE
jgi:succinate dehydrogenase/fumarate reductase flavoprotein subunit